MWLCLFEDACQTQYQISSWSKFSLLVVLIILFFEIDLIGKNNKMLIAVVQINQYLVKFAFSNAWLIQCNVTDSLARGEKIPSASVLDALNPLIQSKSTFYEEKMSWKLFLKLAIYWFLLKFNLAIQSKDKWKNLNRIICWWPLESEVQKYRK